MVPIIFAAFVGAGCLVAFVDWRRGWLLAVLIGVLQDPARKLTGGMPVVMTMSIIVVFSILIFAHQGRMQAALGDFVRRFPNVWSAFGIVLMFLVLAAANGLITFGIGLWKVPLLSFFIYLAPLPAVLFGYMYLQREEMIYDFFRFYAIVTAAALGGSVLEYLRVGWRALGMVLQQGDYIRHLPGLQIRMISGFYRAPDIMAWHAATLTAIGIAMSLRGGFGRRTWPWMCASAWGFYNCMISGRRKAIYYVAIFAIILLWRYAKRLQLGQLVAIVATGLVLAMVVHKMQGNEQSSVYTRGAVTTQAEVTARLEGGIFETFRQFGIMGAGLGTATQGVQHLLGPDQANIGWQEGGLGKLAIEVGLPGLVAIALFGFTLFRLMLQITRHPDLPETSQFARATLFALVMANIGNYVASAQTYSDPVLALIAAFFAGCLFATAALDERVAAAQAEAATALAPATA